MGIVDALKFNCAYDHACWDESFAARTSLGQPCLSVLYYHRTIVSVWSPISTPTRLLGISCSDNPSYLQAIDIRIDKSQQWPSPRRPSSHTINKRLQEALVCIPQRLRSMPRYEGLHSPKRLGTGSLSRRGSLSDNSSWYAVIMASFNMRFRNQADF
jgi:hypothetical protein